MMFMRNRDCKIVATLGPSSDPPERMMMVIEAGVDCFRLNFSHGSKDEHASRVATIREAGAPHRHAHRDHRRPAGPQDPRRRFRRWRRDAALQRDRHARSVDANWATAAIIRLPHPEIVETLEEGDILKLDDGKMQLTVIGKKRHAA